MAGVEGCGCGPGPDGGLVLVSEDGALCAVGYGSCAGAATVPGAGLAVLLLVLLLTWWIRGAWR